MPDEAREAIRDLVRARKRVKEDLREAKQALQSFLLRHDVARAIVANPLQVRAIAHARIKTDAGVLAQLRAADFLPEVWVPDPAPLRRPQMRQALGGRPLDRVQLPQDEHDSAPA